MTSSRPPFTPSLSPQRRPKAPHPKSKFLAANYVLENLQEPCHEYGNTS